MGATQGPHRVDTTQRSHRMGQAVSGVLYHELLQYLMVINRPIDKLPLEILCRVFFNAAEFPYTTFEPSHLRPHRTNLILLKVTAVCKRWRSTALGCAILWKNIAFSTSTRSTIQCARLFLSRSKQVALSVYIWDIGCTENLEIDESSNELLEFVSAQTHRISTCQLSSPSHDFWRHWALPAPNLRKLLLHGHGPEAPPVFRGEFPRLEMFTSKYCTTWPLGNYATLSHVELRNHSRRVTLVSLLEALTGCTMLERLILDGYWRLEQDGPHLTPIHLPRLRGLDLISSDSALILEHLEAPSLRGSVIIFDPNPHRDILHSLPNPPGTVPYLQGITSLVIDISIRTSYHYVAGFRQGGSTAFYVGVYGVPYWAKWSWTQLSFAAVASFAPFSNIRSLTLVTDAAAVPWELWLPKFGRVEELSVSCPKPDDLFTALLGFPPDTRLPLLYSLTLHRHSGSASVDCTRLMEFVLYRYGVARPLRQLRLNKEEWGWIQRLDETWVLLAQSQCKCLVSSATRRSLTSSQILMRIQ